MKALVTGGAGFIGSNLVERLVRDGNEVVVADNLHTGSRENLRGLVRSSCFYELDSKNIGQLSLKTSFKPDVIFHLGMYSSSPMYIRDKSLVSEVIAGATAVFDYAVEQGARVVYASTSSVYNNNPTPYHEGMPVSISDFYTEARLCVERLAALYHTAHGLNSVGLRFFSVYGPREESKGRYANMVTQFAWAAKGTAMSLMGRRPTVYGDGSIERDFVHVRDVVGALMSASAVTLTAPEIVNVGTGSPATFNQALDLLTEASGKDVRKDLDYVPMPAGYMLHQRADTSKAARVLKFRAKVSPDVGIRELLG